MYFSRSIFILISFLFLISCASRRYNSLQIKLANLQRTYASTGYKIDELNNKVDALEAKINVNKKETEELQKSISTQ